MSVIDNYDTLFTAQNTSAKQDTHNAMKDKYRDGRDRTWHSLGRIND